LPHDVNEVRCPVTGLPMKAIKVPRHKPAVGPSVLDSDRKIPAASDRKQPVAPKLDAKAMAAKRESVRPERSLVGRVISDKYGVHDVIGEGGMGAVYEAEHLTIGRLVALKVLHPANAKRADAVQRFHHEARVAGSIGHPNICEIYDVGKLEDGSPYMVMERLHGEALADRIAREGALPWADVIDIVVQVLSALVAAHGKGVIHRDIKPENIFLSARVGMAPVAKLLDFGISKVGTESEDLHLTRTGMVMGTPYYMAPEQARGDRTIDHRIDLYATGAVLYEGLTGRRPFTAPNYNALLVQILSGSPRPLREIRPALPPGFSTIVEKSLEKNRELRFQSAGEFLEALAKLRDELNRAAAAASVKKTEPPPKPSRPPPPPSIPPPEASVEIPVHFTMSSGSYDAVSSSELIPARTPLPSVSDTDPSSRVPDERATVSDVPPVPRAPVTEASDTFVDSLASEDEWQEQTEVHPPVFSESRSFNEGNTPVLGIDLAAVRRKLRASDPPDPTSIGRALTSAEADEIVRTSRERRKALAQNPLRPPPVPRPPAAKPSKLSDRPPIPRADPAGPKLPLPPRAPVDEDDAPTTFFRSSPRVKTEELGEEDEIRDGASRPPPPMRPAARPLPRPNLPLPRPAPRPGPTKK
jgi:serine/threonine protein kinase